MIGLLVTGITNAFINRKPSLKIASRRPLCLQLKKNVVVKERTSIVSLLQLIVVRKNYIVVKSRTLNRLQISSLKSDSRRQSREVYKAALFSLDTLNREATVQTTLAQDRPPGSRLFTISSRNLL